MKNFVIMILILFCMVLGFIYVLTNTPFLLNVMIPDIINRHNQDVHIEYFRCSSQKSQLPDILRMRGVELKVRKGDRLFDIHAGEIVIHNFFDFAKKRELLYISGDKIVVKTENVSAQDAKFKLVVGLNNWNMTFGEGAVFSRVLDIGPYTFERISADIKTNRKGVEVAGIKGFFSEGKMTGKVTVDFEPGFSYVVWSEFTGVQAQSIASPYPEFFSEIIGSLSGSVRVVGSNQVDIFTVGLNAEAGAIISPEVFLKMKGVFDAQEEADLKRLANEKAFLKAERAVLHLQNSRDQKVMIVFDIEESEHQVRLKGNFPLSWDKGFDAFLFPISTP